MDCNFQDPYVEIGKDTRNIAGLEVVVVIQDVQDMPPVFTSAPPITHLPRQVAPRDVVVKVRAEDGDKGAPRQIRYGLVSEGNPFTPFFNINETSGRPHQDLYKKYPTYYKLAARWRLRPRGREKTKDTYSIIHINVPLESLYLLKKTASKSVA